MQFINLDASNKLSPNSTSKINVNVMSSPKRTDEPIKKKLFGSKKIIVSKRHQKNNELSNIDEIFENNDMLELEGDVVLKVGNYKFDCNKLT